MEWKPYYWHMCVFTWPVSFTYPFGEVKPPLFVADTVKFSIAKFLRSYNS